MAVDPLVHAGELLGPRQRQDPPPALLGLGRLAAVPVHHRLAEPELGVFGVERIAPASQTPQSGLVESPSIWWTRAIRANSLRVIESLGAEPARLRVRYPSASLHCLRSMAIAPRLNRMNGSSGRSSSSFEQDPRVAIELPATARPGRHSRYAAP